LREWDTSSAERRRSVPRRMKAQQSLSPLQIKPLGFEHADFIGNASASLLHGGPRTPFLRFGDAVRLEMKDKAGHSILGAIEQTIDALWPAA
jgi:hypothetical protein